MSDRGFTYTQHAPISSLPKCSAPSNIPQSGNWHTEEGIYHGLPSFDAKTQGGNTALVCGANGISGLYMQKVLSRHPELWSRVHTVSRRPPNSLYGSHFTSHSIDLSLSPEELADRFREEGITRVDYLFYYVFSQSKVVDKTRPFIAAATLAEENGALLDNLLRAMVLAGLKPKRVLLQTGSKAYARHLGPFVLPAVEDDLARARFFTEPNFYYTQQDILHDFCRKNDVEWCESRPSFICGIVKEGGLNFYMPLLLYAAITKHMGGTRLRFPGDRRSWDKLTDMTSALHMSYFQQWQMLAPQAGNQSFNITDGSHFGFAHLFPMVASFYGLDAPPPPADEDGTWTSTTFQQDAEIGYPGVRAVTKYQFLMSEWVQQDDVQAAWADMAREHGLDTTLMSDRYTWAILDYAIGTWWSLAFSMSKARKFGYFGTVDTVESLKAVAQEAVDQRIIPKIDATFQW